MQDSRFNTRRGAELERDILERTPRSALPSTSQDMTNIFEQNPNEIVRHGAQLKGQSSVDTSANRLIFSQSARESVSHEDIRVNRQTLTGRKSRSCENTVWDLTNDGAAYEDDTTRIDEPLIDLLTEGEVKRERNVSANNVENKIMRNVENMFAQMAESMTEAFKKITITQNPRSATGRRNIPYKYGGEDYEDPIWFIEKIDSYICDAEIEEELEKITCFTSQLRGKAVKWYETYACLINYYEELKQSFLDEFNSFAEICRIRRRVQGEQQPNHESAVAFIMRKRRMCERVMTDAPFHEIVTMIIDQLEPELGMRVSARNYEDWNDLAKWAKYYEERLELAIRTDSIARYRQPQRPANRQPPPTSNPSNATRPAANPTNQPNSPCRFCGGAHFNRDCPRNPYRQGNARRSEATPATGRPSAPNNGPRPASAPSRAN